MIDPIRCEGIDGSVGYEGSIGYEGMFGSAGYKEGIVYVRFD